MAHRHPTTVVGSVCEDVMRVVLAGFGVFVCAETLSFWVAAHGFGAVWLVKYLQPTGGHISTEPRINDRIRVPEVRLV
jgi:hypothetical protein